MAGPHVHQSFKRHIYGDIVPKFTHCIDVNGWTGRECGKPTKDGAQRCEGCRERHLTAHCGSRFAGVRTIRSEA